MKKFLLAVKALLLFEKYTIYPRWMEIGYSILFWFGLFTIIYAMLK